MVQNTRKQETLVSWSQLYGGLVSIPAVNLRNRPHTTANYRLLTFLLMCVAFSVYLGPLRNASDALFWLTVGPSLLWKGSKGSVGVLA